jgi:hypothetical protein
MLTRLIYASTATGPVDPEVISSILSSARSFNEEHGITGLLCEGNGKFLQYIEGTPEAIDTLYMRLHSDARHKDITLLERSDIQIRAYDDWSMGFVSARNADVQRIILQAANTPQFNPANLNAKQALDLVDLFKEQLYPQVR